MIISASVEMSDWSAAIDYFLAVSRDEAAKASLQGAEEIRDAARALLTERWHSRFSFSPSFPGQAPASIAGDLAASMDAQMMSPDEAWVGPTAGFGRTGDYARIQELGGEMHGHPFMRFFLEGAWWERSYIFLEPRPYLQPATSDVVDSGRLFEIYEQHQLAAILEAG